MIDDDPGSSKLLVAALSQFHFHTNCVPKATEGLRVAVIVWTSKDLTEVEYARLGTSAPTVLQKGRDVGAAVVDEIRAALSAARGSEV